jgi:hypothetical protein
MDQEKERQYNHWPNVRIYSGGQMYNSSNPDEMIDFTKKRNVTVVDRTGLWDTTARGFSTKDRTKALHPWNPSLKDAQKKIAPFAPKRSNQTQIFQYGKPEQEVDDYYAKVLEGALTYWKQAGGGKSLDKVIKGLVGFERQGATNVAMPKAMSDIALNSNNFWGDALRGAEHSTSQLLSWVGKIPGVGNALGLNKHIYEWENNLTQWLRGYGGLSTEEAKSYAHTLMETYQRATKRDTATADEMREFTKDFVQKLDAINSYIQASKGGKPKSYYEQFRADTPGHIIGELLGDLGVGVATGGLGGAAFAKAAPKVAARTIPRLLGGTMRTAAGAVAAGTFLQVKHDINQPQRTPGEIAGRAIVGGVTNMVGAGTTSSLTKNYAKAVAKTGTLTSRVIKSPTVRAMGAYYAKNLGTDILAGAIGGGATELVSSQLAREGYKPTAEQVGVSAGMSAVATGAFGTVFGHFPASVKEFKTLQKTQRAQSQNLYNRLSESANRTAKILSEVQTPSAQQTLQKLTTLNADLQKLRSSKTADASATFQAWKQWRESMAQAGAAAADAPQVRSMLLSSALHYIPKTDVPVFRMDTEGITSNVLASPLIRDKQTGSNIYGGEYTRITTEPSILSKAYPDVDATASAIMKMVDSTMPDLTEEERQLLHRSIVGMGVAAKRVPDVYRNMPDEIVQQGFGPIFVLRLHTDDSRIAPILQRIAEQWGMKLHIVGKDAPDAEFDRIYNENKNRLSGMLDQVRGQWDSGTQFTFQPHELTDILNGVEKNLQEYGKWAQSYDNALASSKKGIKQTAAAKNAENALWDSIQKMGRFMYRTDSGHWNEWLPLSKDLLAEPKEKVYYFREFLNALNHLSNMYRPSVLENGAWLQAIKSFYGAPGESRIAPYNRIMDAIESVLDNPETASYSYLEHLQKPGFIAAYEQAKNLKLLPPGVDDLVDKAIRLARPDMPVSNVWPELYSAAARYRDVFQRMKADILDNGLLQGKSMSANEVLTRIKGAEEEARQIGEQIARDAEKNPQLFPYSNQFKPMARFIDNELRKAITEISAYYPYVGLAYQIPREDIAKSLADSINRVTVQQRQATMQLPIPKDLVVTNPQTLGPVKLSIEGDEINVNVIANKIYKNQVQFGNTVLRDVVYDVQPSYDVTDNLIRTAVSKAKDSYNPADGIDYNVYKKIAGTAFTIAHLLAPETTVKSVDEALAIISNFPVDATIGNSHIKVGQYVAGLLDTLLKTKDAEIVNRGLGANIHEGTRKLLNILSRGIESPTNIMVRKDDPLLAPVYELSKQLNGIGELSTDTWFKALAGGDYSEIPNGALSDPLVNLVASYSVLHQITQAAERGETPTFILGGGNARQAAQFFKRLYLNNGDALRVAREYLEFNDTPEIRRIKPVIKELEKQIMPEAKFQPSIFTQIDDILKQESIPPYQEVRRKLRETGLDWESLVPGRDKLNSYIRTYYEALANQKREQLRMQREIEKKAPPAKKYTGIFEVGESTSKQLPTEMPSKTGKTKDNISIVVLMHSEANNIVRSMFGPEGVESKLGVHSDSIIKLFTDAMTQAYNSMKTGANVNRAVQHGLGMIEQALGRFLRDGDIPDDMNTLLENIQAHIEGYNKIAAEDLPVAKPEDIKALFEKLVGRKSQTAGETFEEPIAGVRPGEEQNISQQDLPSLDDNELLDDSNFKFMAHPAASALILATGLPDENDDSNLAQARRLLYAAALSHIAMVPIRPKAIRRLLNKFFENNPKVAEIAERLVRLREIDTPEERDAIKKEIQAELKKVYASGKRQSEKQFVTDVLNVAEKLADSPEHYMAWMPVVEAAQRAFEHENQILRYAPNVKAAYYNDTVYAPALYGYSDSSYRQLDLSAMRNDNAEFSTLGDFANWLAVQHAHMPTFLGLLRKWYNVAGIPPQEHLPETWVRAAIAGRLLEELGHGTSNIGKSYWSAIAQNNVQWNGFHVDVGNTIDKFLEIASDIQRNLPPGTSLADNPQYLHLLNSLKNTLEMSLYNRALTLAPLAVRDHAMNLEGATGDRVATSLLRAARDTMNEIMMHATAGDLENVLRVKREQIVKAPQYFASKQLPELNANIFPDNTGNLLFNSVYSDSNGSLYALVEKLTTAPAANMLGRDAVLWRNLTQLIKASRQGPESETMLKAIEQFANSELQTTHALATTLGLSLNKYKPVLRPEYVTQEIENYLVFVDAVSDRMATLTRKRQELERDLFYMQNLHSKLSETAPPPLPDNGKIVFGPTYRVHGTPAAQQLGRSEIEGPQLSVQLNKKLLQEKRQEYLNDLYEALADMEGKYHQLDELKTVPVLSDIASSIQKQIDKWAQTPTQKTAAETIIVPSLLRDLREGIYRDLHGAGVGVRTPEELQEYIAKAQQQIKDIESEEQTYRTLLDTFTRQLNDVEGVLKTGQYAGDLVNKWNELRERTSLLLDEQYNIMTNELINAVLTPLVKATLGIGIPNVKANKDLIRSALVKSFEHLSPESRAVQTGNMLVEYLINGSKKIDAESSSQKAYTPMYGGLRPRAIQFAKEQIQITGQETHLNPEEIADEAIQNAMLSLIDGVLSGRETKRLYDWLVLGVVRDSDGTVKNLTPEEAAEKVIGLLMGKVQGDIKRTVNSPWISQREFPSPARITDDADELEPADISFLEPGANYFDDIAAPEFNEVTVKPLSSIDNTIINYVRKYGMSNRTYEAMFSDPSFSTFLRIFLHDDLQPIYKDGTVGPYNEIVRLAKTSSDDYTKLDSEVKKNQYILERMQSPAMRELYQRLEEQYKEHAHKAEGQARSPVIDALFVQYVEKNIAPHAANVVSKMHNMTRRATTLFNEIALQNAKNVEYTEANVVRKAADYIRQREETAKPGEVLPDVEVGRTLYNALFDSLADIRTTMATTYTKQVAEAVSKVFKNDGLWNQIADQWVKRYFPNIEEHTLIKYTGKKSKEAEEYISGERKRLLTRMIEDTAKKALQKDPIVRGLLENIAETGRQNFLSGTSQIQTAIRLYTNLTSEDADKLSTQIMRLIVQGIGDEFKEGHELSISVKNMAAYLQKTAKLDEVTANKLAHKLEPIINRVYRRMQRPIGWLPQLIEELDKTWTYYATIADDIMRGWTQYVRNVPTDGEKVKWSENAALKQFQRLFKQYVDEEWRPPLPSSAVEQSKPRVDLGEPSPAALAEKSARAAEQVAEVKSKLSGAVTNTKESNAYRNLIIRVATTSNISPEVRNEFTASMLSHWHDQGTPSLEKLYNHIETLINEYGQKGREYEKLIPILDEYRNHLFNYLTEPESVDKEASNKLFSTARVDALENVRGLLPVLNSPEAKTLLPVLAYMVYSDDDNDNSDRSYARAALLTGMLARFNKGKAGNKMASLAFGRRVAGTLGLYAGLQIAKEMGLGENDPNLLKVINAIQTGVLIGGGLGAVAAHTRLRRYAQQIIPKMTIHHLFPTVESGEMATTPWTIPHIESQYRMSKGAGWDPEPQYLYAANQLTTTEIGKSVIKRLEQEYGLKYDTVEDLARFIELTDKNTSYVPLAQNVNTQTNPFLVALGGKLHDASLKAKDGHGLIMAMHSVFEPEVFHTDQRLGEAAEYNNIDHIAKTVSESLEGTEGMRYEQFITPHLGMDTSVHGSARYSPAINPLAPFYAAGWSLRNFVDLTGISLSDWKDSFRQWMAQDNKTRKELLKELFPVIVEVDRRVSDMIAERVKKLGGVDSQDMAEKIGQEALALEREIFTRLAHSNTVDAERFPMLVATYYAYRAAHDVSSAALLRSLALSRIPFNKGFTIQDVGRAIDAIDDKRREYAQSIAKIQEKMAGGVDEETEAVMAKTVETFESMMQQLQDVKDDIFRMLEIVPLSAARRYIQHWHMYQGEYRVRWEENGRQYMRIFDTKRQFRKFMNELAERAQRGEVSFITSNETKRKQAEIAGQEIGEDIVDNLLTLEEGNKYKIRYNLDALAQANGEHIMEYTNQLTKILNKAYKYNPKNATPQRRAAYLADIARSIRQLTEDYKIFDSESVSNLTELIDGLERIQRMDTDGIELSSYESELNSIFQSLQQIYVMAHGLNAAELAAPFYVQRIRRTTNQLMHRKNVLGYTDGIQPWQYNDFLASSVALQMQKAVRTYERMLHLREYTDALGLLSHLGLGHSRTYDVINNVIMRDYARANPYSDSLAIRVSGLMRMGIAASALMMNFASALRNWIEATFTGFSSAVQDKILRQLTIKQLMQYWRPILDKNGLPRDPILRAVDEFALAHGLYERGIFSDIAKYSRRASRSKLTKVVSTIEDLGFGLQSATEFQANRGLFLRRLQWEMLTNPESTNNILRALEDEDPQVLLNMVREGLRSLERGQGALDVRGQSAFEHALMRVPAINILTVLMTTVIRLGMQALGDVHLLARHAYTHADKNKLKATLSFLSKYGLFTALVGGLKGFSNQQVAGDIYNIINGINSLFSDSDEGTIKATREDLDKKIHRTTVRTLMNLGLNNKEAELLYSAIRDGWLTAATGRMMSTSGNLTSMFSTIGATKIDALKRLIESGQKDGMFNEEFNRNVLRLISQQLGRLYDAARQLREGKYYSGKYPVNMPFGLSDFIAYALWGTPYELINARNLDEKGYPVFNHLEDRTNFLNKIASLKGIDLGKGQINERDPWQALILMNRDFAFRFWDRIIQNHDAVWKGQASLIKSYYLDQTMKYYDDNVPHDSQAKGTLLDREREQFKRETERTIDALLFAKTLLYTVYNDTEFWSKYRDLMPQTSDGSTAQPAYQTAYTPPYNHQQQIRDYKQIDDIIGAVLSKYLETHLNKSQKTNTETISPYDKSLQQYVPESEIIHEEEEVNQEEE